MKPKKKKKLTREEILAAQEARREKKRLKKLELEKALLAEDTLDMFFSHEKYIPAGDDEFEGHYPGNQNNPILIPRRKGVVHV